MRSSSLGLHMVSVLLLRRVVLAAADSLGHCPAPTAQPRGLQTEPRATDSVVSYEQLKAMLSSHSVQLFDVRNPEEFQTGHISGATNIPLGELEQSLKLAPAHFTLLFNVPPPHKDHEDIVFHCQRGRRSATALEIAHRLGFTRARHYAGVQRVGGV
ncbi:hypothetical protein AAFF_G00363400 [Aldrovandia affinis]|uniref:Rhodanese domain-containing protein n=1 Tax=Aldrovandia affinis TaxID=143900 RepID=A0AAD7R5H6_9TELE|nr:hypothetical protein AAFF_G00363400 [Aldrovandia affinis]